MKDISNLLEEGWNQALDNMRKLDKHSFYLMVMLIPIFSENKDPESFFWPTTYSAFFDSPGEPCPNLETIVELCAENLDTDIKIRTKENYQLLFREILKYVIRLGADPKPTSLKAADKYVHPEQSWLYDILSRKSPTLPKNLRANDSRTPRRIILAFYGSLFPCKSCCNHLCALNSSQLLKKQLYKNLFSRETDNYELSLYFFYNAKTHPTELCRVIDNDHFMFNGITFKPRRISSNVDMLNPEMNARRELKDTLNNDDFSSTLPTSKHRKNTSSKRFIIFNLFLVVVATILYFIHKMVF